MCVCTLTFFDHSSIDWQNSQVACVKWTSSSQVFSSFYFDHSCVVIHFSSTTTTLFECSCPPWTLMCGWQRQNYFPINFRQHSSQFLEQWIKNIDQLGVCVFLLVACVFLILTYLCPQSTRTRSPTACFLLLVSSWPTDEHVGSGREKTKQPFGKFDCLLATNFWTLCNFNLFKRIFVAFFVKRWILSN